MNIFNNIKYYNSITNWIDYIPFGIAVFDKNKRLIYINKFLTEILKLPDLGNLDSVIDLIEYSNLPIDIQDKLKDIFNNISEKEDNIDEISIDLNILDKFYNISIQPIKQDNYILIVYDITNQKIKEQTKLEFLSIATHEIKTPIAAITGFIDLLQDGIAGELNEEQKDYLTKIQIQTDKLNKLVNDLLDFSKLEAGQMKLYFQEFNVRELINEVLDIIFPFIKSNKCQVSVDISDEVQTINADYDKMKQILLNLIDNAIKFQTKDKVCKIIIKIYRALKDIIFEVIDNGIGIDNNTIKCIFDKFYKAKNINKEYINTGLGLFITKRLVELHNGSITVTSKLNEGSIFRFTIPY